MTLNWQQSSNRKTIINWELINSHCQQHEATINAQKSNRVELDFFLSMFHFVDCRYSFQLMPFGLDYSDSRSAPIYSMQKK